jgi:membrane-bound metal-dependent hydrolase YbcI (DUF457 family)
MTPQSTSNSLVAALCGLLTLNIYTLLPLFISIPPFLDLRLATLYVLALQGLISLVVVRLFYIATRRPFRLRCRRTLVLMLLYAVFPVPRLAIWVLDSVVPGICVRKGFCKVCCGDVC